MAEQANGLVAEFASTRPAPESRRSALVELGNWLIGNGYSFTTVTPETHRRVIERRAGAAAATLRDVFGWSLPFRAAAPLPEDVLRLLDGAGELDRDGIVLRTRVRFSTLDGMAHPHSSYPTTQADAVFFGPDTYRFVALIRRELSARPLPAGATIIDIGCGSGAGGLGAARLAPASRVILADINPRALDYAAVSARLAGVDRCDVVLSDVLQAIDDRADLIVANPPYLVDAAERTYRHGGGALGADLSLRILREALPQLAPGGRLILYTGSAIIDGEDCLRAAAEPLLRSHAATWTYEELDPDVFGEELAAPAYASAERIAVVGLVARLPGASSE